MTSGLLSPGALSLRIDTSTLDQDYAANPTKSPSEGSSIRTRARALSQAALPSLRILSSPSSDKAPISPIFPPATPGYSAPAKEKAEYQKLVELQLDQLRRRPRAPPFHELLFQSASRLHNKNKHSTIPGPTKTMANINNLVNQGDSDDDDTIVSFSSETAAVRTKHLRDVLQTAMDRGWDVFELRGFSRRSRTSSSDDAPSRLSASPFRRRRRSQSYGRSRSPSPAPESGEDDSPTLFVQCLQLLHSLISEDCRFPISPPRLESPPYALQAFCLDIAQLLAHAHRTHLSVLSQIGFAVIPAFSTFHPQMLSRLLQFFEEVLLRRMLELSRTGQASRYRDDDRDVSPGDDDTLNLVPTLQLPPSIQVEEADEPMNQPLGEKTWHHWLASSGTSRCISSSNTPGQATVLYHSTSLVTPLLAALLERINLDSSPFMTLHRFYRLFDMIVELKPDSYLDILQIVAYHTQTARRIGLSLLSSYWPRSLGHFTVSKPLDTLTAPSLTSALHATSHDRNPRQSRSHGDPYAHHFVPWRFQAQARPVVFNGTSVNDCKSCHKSINGFALFCPLCMSAVHFDCYDYPGGNLLAQYSLVSDPNKQKVAMHRFCHSATSRQPAGAEVIRASRHTFRPVDLFALSLCFVCQQPLWGCRQQGVKCDTCDRFAHASCVSPSMSVVSPCESTHLDSTHMTISWNDLQSSFHRSFAELLSSVSTLGTQGYEEISVAFDVLWMQRAILQNGITLGSIVVEGHVTTGMDGGVLPEFELDSLIAAHEDALRTPFLQVSACLSEFLQENQLAQVEHSIMYDWSALTFIASTVKTPLDSATSQSADSSDFLAAQPIVIAPGDSSSNPYEVLSLAHIRDALGIYFNLHSEIAARYVLGHLHHVGLYERLGSEDFLSDDFNNPRLIQCVFPLPLGLDMSVDVEVLVSAIEASLSDISLSINEAGFLLLTRRFWPNQMATGYALRRLARALVSWIIGEDDSLAVILREHVALNRAVPGVRAVNEQQPWPHSASATVHPNSVNSGGDYVAQRRALLHKYAAVWLLALHDQDITFYALTIYDIISELAEEYTAEEKIDPADVAVSVADISLRSIVRINQANVIFTAFDDMFLRWLENNSGAWNSRKPILSLQRLFNRDGGVNARSSSARALTMAFMDPSIMSAVDPWDIFMRSASSDQQTLQRGIRWLRMFAISAVDIPTYVFEQFSSISARFRLDVQELHPLASASLFSTWLKSLGRQDLLGIIGGLHVRLSKEVLGALGDGGAQNALYFIRVTLATCLLLAGCERDALIRRGFILEEEVRNLPSRRTLNSRAAAASSDPISLSSRFVAALGDYIDFGTEEINTVIAKFFHLFVTECPFLESYEVDNFILRNSGVLCASAWKFYDLQYPQLYTVRPNFLLRVLVVDSSPFEELIESALSPAHPWERRLASLKRLFRIVLDVTNPAFILEDRQWRSSVICIFNAYFSALWQDSREEIRVAVETWSHTLLPAHFEAIAHCWNEALTKAPIQDRVKLSAFLLQLHPHFRTWQTLSWNVIVETLMEMEEDYVHRGENEDALAAPPISLSSRNSIPYNIAEDLDEMILHISTVSLSLKLLSAGVTIDLFNLLKIKLYLLRIAGFQDVISRPSASGQSFYVVFGDLSTTPDHAWPCIDELLTILDSPFSFSFSSAAMPDLLVGQDESTTLLIGSIFLDVLLAVINQTPDLLAIPFLSTKSLLESLLVVIYKHDLDSKPLRHLTPELRRAVRRVLAMSLEATSYELRQLALSVVQSYVKHRPSHTSNFVGDAVDTIAQLLVNLRFSQEDVLATQALSFLETSVISYGDKGLLLTLLRKSHEHTFYVVLRLATTVKRGTDTESRAVRDTLLRDTLLRLSDLDADNLQAVLDNLCTFIHEVHNEGLSAELMQSIGAFFNSVARRAADGSMNGFDPSPLLLITSMLIEKNKAQSRDLMLQTETLLRTTLVRFRLSSHSLMRILQVTIDLSRKNRKLSMFNSVSLAFLETLSDALRGGNYTLSFTLCGMAEAVIQEIIQGPAKDADDAQMWLTRFANDGMVYLLSSNFTEGDADINASLRVAHLVFYGAERKPEILHQPIVEQYQGKSSRLLSLGAWNVLLLAALSHASTGAATALMRHFSGFTLTYRDSLASPTGLTSQASNINHCYTSIKLWLLLERKISGASVKSQMDSNVGTFTIWNELWSPFLLLLSELTSSQTGMQAALASVASASVADLLLFLRDFHSVISLENVQQVSTIKAMRLIGRSEAMTTKLDRTMRDIHQPSPPVPWEVLVEQAKNDVAAAMKLERLESQTRPREPGRAVGDWQWRDSRAIG
ncbi:hypothetical protein OF83DRAFT_1279816 [Amylostereum chailletii]|nr:hypothetical protein OF83DRAFT_1279816 [Amylostereum chailletii]